MKSIIRVSLLIFFAFDIHAKGIQVFHNNELELALKAFHHFHSLGIPKELISVIQRKDPCLQTYENSFIDICFENGEMKIIRKTKWSQKTLEPFLSSRELEVNQ